MKQLSVMGAISAALVGQSEAVMQQQTAESKGYHVYRLSPTHIELAQKQHKQHSSRSRRSSHHHHKKYQAREFNFLKTNKERNMMQLSSLIRGEPDVYGQNGLNY